MSLPNVLMPSKGRDISPPTSALLALYCPDLHLNQLWHSIKAPPEENNLWFFCSIGFHGALECYQLMEGLSTRKQKVGEYIVRSREENPRQGTQTCITTAPQHTGCCVPAGDPPYHLKTSRGTPWILGAVSIAGHLCTHDHRSAAGKL